MSEKLKMIKELRDFSGISLIICKRVLIQVDWNLEKAKCVIRRGSPIKRSILLD